jgi:hypothetical protein
MNYFDFFNPKAKTTNMVKSPTYYDFSDSLPQFLSPFLHPRPEQ